MSSFAQDAWRWQQRFEYPDGSACWTAIEGGMLSSTVQP
jgi:hypothetical protein